MMTPNPLTFQNLEFVVLCVILFALGYMRQTEFDTARIFVRSFTNESLVSQQIRQERSFRRLSIPVFLIGGMSVSYFVTQVLISRGLNPESSFISLFLGVIITLFILSSVRLTVYAGISWLFNLDRFFDLFSFHWTLNLFIMAISLLPISMLISFGPPLFAEPLIIVGIVLLFSFYLLRSFRMFTIVQTLFRIPLMYNIFYLCALELLPLALVITAIMRYGVD